MVREASQRGFGIARIRLSLELMLHVRMHAPEHFDAPVAAVRDLSNQNVRLLAGVLDGAEVKGPEAFECNRAYDDHWSWEDLLFVLGEYGVLEATADERKRWEARIDEQRERRASFEEWLPPEMGQKEPPAP